MGITQTPQRTPLHEMTSSQLAFIAEDDLAPQERREIAREILSERFERITAEKFIEILVGITRR